MPNCLENLVGLRGCTAYDPEPVMYLNDMEGMSTELLDKIASQDQITYVGVWNSIQNRAYQKLKTSVQKALKQWASVRLDQVIFQTSKPFVQQWSQVDPLPASDQYRGVFASVQGSKYIGLRIKTAFIYNSGGATVNDVPIKVFETQTGEVLYETTANVAPGVNWIPINQVFTPNFNAINIALLVDASGLDTLSGSFVDYGWQAWDNECANRWNWWLTQPGFSNFPVTASLDYGLGSRWTQNNAQSGVYWDAELICSLDAFICAQKEYLVDAWSNLLAAQTLKSKLLSNRVNYFTQSNRDITERNMATMEADFKEALNNWAEQLNLVGEGLCFNCEDESVVSRTARRP